ADVVSGMLAGTSAIAALFIAFLVYLYSHYGFGSLVSHITAMYAALIAVVAAAGAPPFMAAFVIAIAANLCGSLTHYGTGPAPLYFNAGYVDQVTWWRIGFILSVIQSVIWIAIGSVWWKLLGLM
ncbi:MAG: anion permease, partial [Sporomusa sp.]